MDLAYGTGAYRRDYGDLPELLLKNMYVEPSPTSEKGVVLQCRKGLTNHTSPGDGPIDGIFHKSGLFNNSIFTISGIYLYKDNAQIGVIMGSGPVSWAASDTELVVTRGTFVYSYDGTDFQSISIPDGSQVTAVTYIAGLFLFVKKNSHRIYFSAVMDARTVDSLDFFSAELAPDYVLDIWQVLGTLYLFGAATTEVWFPSGNVDLPFSRIDQRLFGKGVKATGAVCEIDDALVITADDGLVYRIAGGPEPISHFGIEERIKGSATVSMFSFTYEGHKFACIRLATATLAIDMRTQEWCEFTTYGRDNWRAQCATNVGDTPYFGDDEEDDVWKFGTTFIDGSTQLEAYFSIVAALDRPFTFDNLVLSMNSGQTQPLSGDDANPLIEMRTSRDAGRTFNEWKSASLGAQGEYRRRVIWRRLGQFDDPGFVAELRMTDQSPRRLSTAKANQVLGGRSR